MRAPIVAAYQYPYNASTPPVYTLYWLTDLHLGARACREDLLRADIARIVADPNAIVGLGGDIIDGIARKGDKRHKESTYAPWLHGEDDVLAAQVDYADALLSPIASKIVAVTSGNHEFVNTQYAGNDVYSALISRIAQRKGVEPGEIALGVHGFISLTFRSVAATGTTGRGYGVTIYAHHGYGGGALAGGDALHLQRLLRGCDADLVLVGHRHRLRMIEDTVIGVSQNLRHVVQRSRLAVMMPSYLDSTIKATTRMGVPINTYAEEKGYGGGAHGVVPIAIFPQTRSFEVRAPSFGTREIA